MLTQDIKDKIEAIVTDKVALGEIFSAYDVTQALNANGFVARNKEVRDVVHAVYTDRKMASNYARNHEDLGGDIEAYVYFPTGKNSSDHPKCQTKTASRLFGGTTTGRLSSTSPNLSQLPSTLPTIGSFFPQNSGSTTPTLTTPPPTRTATPRARNRQVAGPAPVDNRNRICVSATALRSLGLKPGDTAHVVVDKTAGQLSVHAQAPVTNFKVKTFLVDRRNNVRIRLHSLGLNSAAYDIKPDGDKVLLTAL